MQKKLILENWLSPGDIVMLTAAIRDLHHCYPGQFLTDVRTSCPDLWAHNPLLTPLDDTDRQAQRLETHYPLIHQSNSLPYHFIHGFIEYLNDQLDLRIRPTAFKGDIHLAQDELTPHPLLHPLGSNPPPYWIIAAGGKYDYTIKWWHRRRWQAVVDHFQRRLQFVQVGEKGHYHPPLKGVLDLRGKTSLRDLIRLIYHADGILCPVTLHMHLAAAVPLPPGRSKLRHCVVVAGGREPPHWESYPGHHFLHTIGSLDCCATGGCWKSRTVPLGDGSPLDSPDSICLNVQALGIPKCMEIITDSLVTRTIHNCTHIR